MYVSKVLASHRDRLSQSHVARLAFAAVVARSSRHRAKEASSSEAGKQDHARICACQVRQPTTYLHSQSHRITRPSASSKDFTPSLLQYQNHSRVSCNTSQPSSQTKVSADNLEFLQRPNGDSDLPVAAPIEPLGGGDPAPETEPVKAPEHHEESHAPKPAPSASEKKPAQESQSNGTPVESKPAEPQSADMSYADIAAKGPKQTDEEKYVIT
jgi:hypothetical protein